MNQEILEKLHAALYAVSPIAKDRERIIAEMGETIWIESLEKMLNVLPDERQKEVIVLLNAGDLEKAVEIFDAHNVDMDAIITAVSTSVMDEVLATNA